MRKGRAGLARAAFLFPLLCSSSIFLRNFKQGTEGASRRAACNPSSCTSQRVTRALGAHRLLGPPSTGPQETISEEDVAGPFERQIPRPLEQMAKLHGLTYKSPLEELSEKFHMSENLLRTLNPGADFDRAGKTIMVADVEPMALGTQSKPSSRHANRSRAEAWTR